jgi:rifampicin phosphotransferase
MVRRSRLLDDESRCAADACARGACADGCPPAPVDGDAGGYLVGLDHPAAVDAGLAGAKAAALARAAARGLPVLPGFVLTTASGGGPVETVREVRRSWCRLSGNGATPLVVRSSSTVEDGATSSMAGAFTSVLDVRGWDAFVEAVAEVRRSAGGHPMAVLVQPLLDAAVGGVLFGMDPVSGRRDRLVVEAVEGGPAQLVSGLVTATRQVLTHQGRLVEEQAGPGGHHLRRAERRSLASLAAATARAFGGPQDVEWAADARGRMWLLQSRPITSAAAFVPSGAARLGAGPVAETFPDRLATLEADLWVGPLRDGVAEALRLVGGTPAAALARSPVVTTVGGSVVADLDLLEPRRPRSMLGRLDPRPPGRRLVAAWRVGRLRRALPALATDAVRAVDADLAAVPALAQLDDAGLLTILRQSDSRLRALHGYEVLAGMLTPATPHTGPTAAAVALDRLGGRAAHAEPATEADHPVLLTLSAPAIGRAPTPPGAPGPAAGGGASIGSSVGDLPPREALRLRARWVQELTALAAAELGHRLHAAARLDAPLAVRHLRVDELAAVVDGQAPPPDLAARRGELDRPVAPLPAAFRLAVDRTPVADRPSGGATGGGRGAGGGRGSGPVTDLAGGAQPTEGTVLVVRTLEPTLAPYLPGLAGLVSETGSVLSHLAILARELGVPTVVGVEDARTRFPAGSVVIVDGATGEVAGLEEDPC